MKAILGAAILIITGGLTGVGCAGETPGPSEVAGAGASRAQVAPTPLSPNRFTVDQTANPPVAPGQESDWLTEILMLLPASVSETGVWLSNPIPPLEYAGLRPARGHEEWMSWTPEQQQDYQDARAGIPNSGIHYTMTQSYPDWDETFGFGAWDVGAMAETGEMQWEGFQVNVLTGEFDADRINGKLLGLGYESRKHRGGTYLALPEGDRLDLDWLPQVVVNSDMRNVLALERAVLTAPTAGSMEELLSVRAGEIPSLAEQPAFGDLVSILSEPLFVSILDRSAVKNGEDMRSMGIALERPDRWGSAGNWEALIASYSRPSPESQKITVALWYEEMADGQEAVPEFVRRFKQADPSEFSAEWYLQEVCSDFWEIGASNVPSGAVLTISCQIDSGPSSESLGSLMHSAFVEGSLGFLLN